MNELQPAWDPVEYPEVGEHEFENVEPKKFTEAFFTQETITLGTPYTEWITSDTVIEVKQ